jgi:murein DD-endopeptidase MepM/ murein hydrolase activator NlpD
MTLKAIVAYLVICLAVVLAGLSPAGAPSSAVLSANLAVPTGSNYSDLLFSDPFGVSLPHTRYQPRITRDGSDKLIEDTSYGVLNPDMTGATCFGVDWSHIYHAGEDLYAGPASSPVSTENAEVRAVADGVVKFAPTTFNYPGFVVIIEHTLRSGEKVYSVYAHLKGPLNVAAGQQVKRGQLLGKVMYLAYNGNYPQYHPSGDDSHLHFEIRQFYSGTNIYPYPYDYCNKAGNVPGVGYTYPTGPDIFPASSQHYINPYVFIWYHQGRTYIPQILK